jgi:hypothetical protein
MSQITRVAFGVLQVVRLSELADRMAQSDQMDEVLPQIVIDQCRSEEGEVGRIAY